ncbi:Fe-S-containing protein [Winkia sp. UMB3158]|uniref:Membrane iron-sulfur containing protein FtrD-like domain-containing protein n=2 Tax=Winkia neuii TaxID=33007 RepID=K0Z165_9ACTO|nr:MULTISPECIES: Fe-S-containing protein [Winkia]MCG7302430.1 Fe-S-containing protein [Winkia sp. ACRQY]MDK8341877.1 Fe-S-containing protein [Winkia sp. UMB3164B]OFT37992.1 hypothetical protein HMPREF3163_07575 [Actinomyces sp. HMSC08A01]PLB79886.1 DUF2318 domain-containing protein [Actinomyces sp. UMB0138]PMC93869.1 DUF2318 domain-containing protein [Actinomyces sp. UMB0918]
MLEQLVQVVASLLLVSLTLGALSPTLALASGGDPVRPGSRPVLWGTVLGALLGLAMVIVHLYSIIRFDRQHLTLTTLEPTIGLGLVTLVLIWINGRKTLKAMPLSPSDRPVRRPWALAAQLCGSLWVVLTVFRASQQVYMQARTFVPVGATFFSTPTFLNIVGYCLGLALVLVAGLGVARMCRVRPTFALIITTLFMLLVSSGHVFLLLRLLYSIRAIYLVPAGVAFLTFLVNHEPMLTFAAVAITVCAAIYLYVRGRALKISGPNPAAKRLKRARSRSMRRAGWTNVIAMVISLIVLTVGAHFASGEIQLSPPEAFQEEGTNVVIPLKQIDDGHLHRFEYPTKDGTKVRFIVIKKAGSAYGVGLDACDICGASGYYEKDGHVICKLCEVAMNIATIGFKGGCNPIPLEYSVTEGKLTVPKSALEGSVKIFK